MKTKINILISSLFILFTLLPVKAVTSIEGSGGTGSISSLAYSNFYSSETATMTAHMKMFSKVAQVMSDSWYNSYYFVLYSDFAFNNAHQGVKYQILLTEKANGNSWFNIYTTGLVKLSYTGNYYTFNFSSDGSYISMGNGSNVSYSNEGWKDKTIYTTLPTRYQTLAGSTVFSTFNTISGDYFKTSSSYGQQTIVQPQQVGSTSGTGFSGGGGGVWTTTDGITTIISGDGNSNLLTNDIFHDVNQGLIDFIGNQLAGLYESLSKMPILQDLFSLLNFIVNSVILLFKLLIFILGILYNAALYISGFITDTLFSKIFGLSNKLNILFNVLPQPINYIGNISFTIFASILSLRIVSTILKIVTMRS